MGAPGEQIRGKGFLKGEAPFFQQGHIPGKGGRVAGDIDQAPGVHSVNGFNGIRVQALPGRIHGDDVGADAFRLQLQGGGARIGAEEFRIFDAVAHRVFPGVLHCLGDHLHTDDPSRGGGHGKGDGAHPAVEVQHQILLCDLRQGDGLPVEPLGLMVVHLIKGSGGQTEIETAEGILNIAGAIQRDKFVPQHRVSLFGVDAEHQGGKTRHRLQRVNQTGNLGQAIPIDHQAHQNLTGNGTPANIDMPQQAPVGGFVIHRHPVFVDIIHHNRFDPVGFLRQNPAAGILHHLMGPGLEESRVGSALFPGHRVLGLVPVALTGGGRQNGQTFQVFAADAVQAVGNPLGLQPGFLFIVQVPEITAAAELGNGAGPVHPVRGPFQNLHNFSGSPGFPGLFNAQLHPLSGHSIGQEHHAALHMGNALALFRVIGDGCLVDLIFEKHGILLYRDSSI